MATPFISMNYHIDKHVTYICTSDQDLAMATSSLSVDLVYEHGIGCLHLSIIAATVRCSKRSYNVLLKELNYYTLEICDFLC